MRVAAQATPIERQFIQRANEVRDSLGLEPLVLMEEYQRVSRQHAGYIFKTEHVSHTQERRWAGYRLYPSATDRNAAFGPAGSSAWAEIITFGRSRGGPFQNLDSEGLARKCVQNFLDSPMHRMILLDDYFLNCTVGIIHTPFKYVCVVNFLSLPYRAPDP